MKIFNEKSMKKYIQFFLLPLLVWSCQEDVIKPYQGGRYVYFSQLMNSTDSVMEVSFNNYPLSNELTVKIGLGLVGDTLAQNTPYKVIVVDSATTANPVNYRLPKKTLFKAGSATDTLQVTLIKTDDLKENVTLCLQLVQNENFVGSVKQYQQIKIVFNNMISKPLWWNSDVVKFYLGTYSRTKYEALIKYTGISDFGSLNAGEKRQCALKLKAAIEQYNLKDKDDEGNEIPMEVTIY